MIWKLYIACRECELPQVAVVGCRAAHVSQVTAHEAQNVT